MKDDIQKRWSEVCDRWATIGYDSLIREEKAWMNVRGLIDSIENGGLISYFYNSYADTIQDCLIDLDVLGADSVKQQVLRVCALFPDKSLADQEARNEVINSWYDGEEESTIDVLLDEVDDVLMPLMADLEKRLKEYLKENRLVA